MYNLRNKLFYRRAYCIFYLVFLDCCERTSRLATFLTAIHLVLNYSYSKNIKPFIDFTISPFLTIISFTIWIASIIAIKKTPAEINSISKEFFVSNLPNILKKKYSFNKFIYSISSFMQVFFVIFLAFLFGEAYVAGAIIFISAIILLLFVFSESTSKIALELKPTQLQMIFFISLVSFCLIFIWFNLIKSSSSLVIILYSARFSTLYYSSFLNMMAKYICFRIHILSN